MSSSKKISAVIPSDIYSQIEAEHLTISEVANNAFRFYFENRSQMVSDKEKMISDEKKISNLEHQIIMRDGQLYDADEHIKDLKKELDNVYAELRACNQNFNNHVLQTQTLINRLPAPKEKKWFEFWK